MYLVAPSAGAWIEIYSDMDYIKESYASLPPRERGLKSILLLLLHPIILVAPSAGAWIEIYVGTISSKNKKVAPSAGAWIEITKHCSIA